MTEQELALGHFSRSGHRAAAVPGFDTSLESMDDPDLDLVYLQPADDARALEELRQVKSRRPNLAVVLVCAQPSVHLTVEAWCAGASDILFLPLTPESLDASLQRAASRIPGTRAAKYEDAQARFRYLDETGNERWIAIVPPKLTIGRSSNNGLVLAKMNISRSQAEVVAEESGDYILRDLGSKHGTFVNGTRIQQAVLNHGDRVRLGGLQGEALTFHKGDLLQSLLASSGSKPEAGLPVHDFREMGMLLSTFHALSSIPLLDDLLNLVVDTAIELTGADRGFIMLKEGDGRLSFRCARNAHKQSMDGDAFQTSRRVPEEVFQTGKRIVIDDLEGAGKADDHDSTRRLGVRSISCVPLRYLPFHDSVISSGIVSTEIIGVLYVDSVRIGSSLSPARIECFYTLASEAAMAIYNARLYKESREKQKMAEELAIAREIQQALLPPPEKTLPFASACSVNLPCREVGGDYFDYFDIGDGQLGFALGDVAGKGMPAALLAAMLQGIFCAQTLLDLPLPKLIAIVNRSLAKRMTGSRFVTLFFGILDADGNCTYINAGHNPPLLVRTDGSMRELTEGGMVLGLFPQAQYEAGAIRLEPGEHLVLFTDGVLEARNMAGEEFSEQRVRDLLQLNSRADTSTILRCLQEALAAFSANTPQHDDITMMVLGYRETPQG
jgi:serine phosphatase RsbU (regulator of sigma subunit)/pSer/pThr/pTyr-binding forkhead associated (FHA) protein